MIPTLQAEWLDIVREYAILANYSPASVKNYKAIFFTSWTVESVMSYFRSAAPSVLLASASLFNFEVKKKKKKESEFKFCLLFCQIRKQKDASDVFQILLGVSVNCLVENLHEESKVISALKSWLYLLTPKTLSLNILSHSVCQVRN